MGELFYSFISFDACYDLFYSEFLSALFLESAMVSSNTYNLFCYF